jgi:hypothetical protein
MPLAVHVNESERLRYTVASGKVTDRDVLETYGEMLADPTFDPTLDHLVDMSAVEEFEITSAVIRGLAEFMAFADGALPEGMRRKAAIVATTPQTVAAVLLYRSRRVLQQAPVTVRSFRTIEDAKSWLGRG